MLCTMIFEIVHTSVAPELAEISKGVLVSPLYKSDREVQVVKVSVYVD